ncbi:MAG: hypothetical protein H7Y43_18145 [Akkermansiaceae bacterium]|nr:hypothetical protein [Verrucomicrobiales bacterium]
MIKSSLKLGLFCIITAILTTEPSGLNAQETNKIVEKKATKEKSAAKPGVTPFRGKLKAVDKTAKTITIGETTIQITSETKIMKEGKPATLDDTVIGEMAAGAYRKTDDGKQNATTIRFGAKPETETDADMVKEKKTRKVQ